MARFFLRRGLNLSLTLPLTLTLKSAMIFPLLLSTVSTKLFSSEIELTANFTEKTAVTKNSSSKEQDPVVAVNTKGTIKDDTKKNSKPEKSPETVKQSNKEAETFTPTEDISEDLAVSFPIDI